MTLPLDHIGPVLHEGASGTVRFLKYPMYITGNKQAGIAPTPYGEFTPGATYEFWDLLLGNDDLAHCGFLRDDKGNQWLVDFFSDCWKIINVSE